MTRARSSSAVEKSDEPSIGWHCSPAETPVNKLAALFPRHHTIILYCLYTFIVSALMLNDRLARLYLRETTGSIRLAGNYSSFLVQGNKVANLNDKTIETHLCTTESSKAQFTPGSWLNSFVYSCIANAIRVPVYPAFNVLTLPNSPLPLLISPPCSSV